ncbi:hypothetical protein Tco_0437858 [Tanacetum coccineum]
MARRLSIQEVFDEGPNATLPVNDETVGDEIVDDDVPKERVKGRFKITGKRKLYQVFDEDEDDEDYGHF